ncbi:MAG TPA: hypothetical protein ENK02_02460 [Planctomycetes bacterium]|nr:hypothetical protein [Planctomycetota bacterium]
MDERTPTKTQERRSEERRESSGEVRLRILTESLPGPIRDFSKGGVCFVTEGAIEVEVVLQDGDKIRGTLVRAGTVREGEISLAVRFDEPLGDDHPVMQ